MANYVSAQLISFARTALLGLVAGTVYDLLRCVRLRCSRGLLLTHLLDTLYVAAALLVLFLFTLKQGEGEMRLYMLLAIVLGQSVYFLALSPVFTPIWRLWVDTVAEVLTLFGRPLIAVLRCAKKFQIYIKKLFYFWRKYATIGK